MRAKTLENFRSRRPCEVVSQGLWPQTEDRAEGDGERKRGSGHAVAFDFGFVSTVAGDRLLAAAHQKQRRCAAVRASVGE